MVAAVDLRKLAQGQLCYLRLSGHCRHAPEYTVLAHIRRFNIAGGGQKPPDVCAFPACDKCHDIIDGRMPQRLHGFERYELDIQSYRALLQWLAYLTKHDIAMVRL
jgi:hypothetical protein